MKKTCVAVSLLLLTLFFSAPVHAASGDSEKKLTPTPVPVNLKPPSQDEYYLGVGFNLMTIKVDWDDNFFTTETENVGDLKYDVKNLAVALVKSTKNKSTIEYDLLLGKITGESDTSQYHSGILNKDVNIKADIDGYNVGVRVVKSKTLKTRMRNDRKFIDWNYALSLHAALFSTSSTFTARSVDTLNANVYDENETGIFLRPVIALQPIIYLHKNVSLIPHVGVGTMLTLSGYAWEDKEFVSGGSATPADQLGDDWGLNIWTPGIDTRVGFDIGIITSGSKKHELTVGGAISKLFGGADADFTEIHAIYTIPYAL